MTNLSSRASRYLKEIGETEESSKRLTRNKARLADELIQAGLAIIIPVSTGGGEICLTDKGLELIDEGVQ